jgi:hypothetical protein
MSDESNEATKEEGTAPTQKEQIASAGKALAGQGFSKEQIAKQLSSKFQVTVDEATAALADNDDEPKKDDA